MAPNKRLQKRSGNRKNANRDTSDYKLIFVLAGAVILAFLMIYILIYTMPA